MPLKLMSIKKCLFPIPACFDIAFGHEKLSRILDVRSISIINYGKDGAFYAESFRNYYTEILEEPWRFTVITNVNEHLNQLFGGESCLLILNNFHNVNLYEFQAPLIVRTPLPLLLSGDDSYAVLTGVSSQELVNLTFLELEILKCPISKFWTVPGNMAGDICIRLNTPEFMTNIGTISCVLHVGLYPPVYMLGSYARFYPRR